MLSFRIFLLTLWDFSKVKFSFLIANPELHGFVKSKRFLWDLENIVSRASHFLFNYLLSALLHVCIYLFAIDKNIDKSKVIFSKWLKKNKFCLKIKIEKIFRLKMVEINLKNIRQVLISVRIPLESLSI